MLIIDLLSHKIGVLGYGKEGKSLIDLLRQRGYTHEIWVFADQPLDPLPDGLRYMAQEKIQPQALHDRVIVLSPGFPPHHPLRLLLEPNCLTYTTATAVFLTEMRQMGIATIGITASKGKSTLSSLVHKILLQAKIDNLLVGNIGIPALSALESIQQHRPVVVMELSSYQCDLLSAGMGPSCAYLGPIYPEHLNYHGSFEHYKNAKLRILSSQHNADFGFIDCRQPHPYFPELYLGKSLTPTNLPTGLHFHAGYFWDDQERLFSDQECILKGMHNRQNACAALAIAQAFGGTPSDLEEVLQTWPGLPIRLQELGIYRQIRWINDSASTIPQSTLSALQTYQDSHSLQCLIVGGYDRNIDLTDLIHYLTENPYYFILALPSTGWRLVDELQNHRYNPLLLHKVDTVADAVVKASLSMPNGGVCLFSPGAASYNQYQDFYQRGADFEHCVKALSD
ncbi:MAG: UDP-N-acetylmuramoyl-L-alanine--D-glutamate ligase [Gammaproteobacteria bacterium]|nr:UDP-N-acetylmuramoyl-L-alanine--D-glutamate ligase [Gammaproteobacteria bacterium]